MGFSHKIHQIQAINLIFLSVLKSPTQIGFDGVIHVKLSPFKCSLSTGFSLLSLPDTGAALDLLPFCKDTLTNSECHPGRNIPLAGTPFVILRSTLRHLVLLASCQVLLAPVCHLVLENCSILPLPLSSKVCAPHNRGSLPGH
jgi:hypothetical protein